MRVAFCCLAALLGAAPARETVDLLALIDPVQGASGGTWTKTAEGLVSPGRPFARVLIPYAPPEEYDVAAVVERQGDSNSINLGLAVGERQFLVILDAKQGAEYLSGLDLVDGKPFMGNETTVKGAFFVQGKPGTVVCSVRKDRVTVTVDGRKAIDWKADYTRLSLFSAWSVAHKNCLLLGSWTSVIRVSKLELTAVGGGAGRKLADPPAPEVPLDRLAPAEVDVRVRATLARMDSEAFADRDAAQKELERYPVQWLPRVAQLAAEKDSPELRYRLQNLGITLPWAKVLRGTVREALATVQALEKPGAPRTAAIHAFVLNALGLPLDEARAFFEALLDSPKPGLRELGLAGLSLLPGPSSARALDFLERPETCQRAADVLIAAGDPKAAGRVLSVYAAGRQPQADQAARALGLLDPAAGVEIASVNLGGNMSLTAIHLLARSGAADVPAHRFPDALPVDVRRALATVGGARAVASLRASSEASPDPEDEAETILMLRDPLWARDWIVKYGEKATELDPDTLTAIAAAGGTGAREAVLAWLDRPGLKTGERRKLLPLLGVVGTGEDAARLVRALEDPRLIVDASEGLDRLGDPAHAAVLLDAWKRSTRDVRLGAAASAPSAAGLNEHWVEILSDPDGYGVKWKEALKLAGHLPSPGVRDALWTLAADSRLITARLAAVDVLEGSPQAGDLPRILKLRADRQPAVAADGLWLAARSGDVASLAELAALLADVERAQRFRFPPPERLRLLDRVAAAGPAWAAAVAAEWARRPGWDEGAAWLAGEGDPKAREHLAPRLAALPEPIRRHLDQKDAARGDVDALSRLLKRIVSRLELLPEEEAAFLKGAGPEVRERVLAYARLAAWSGADAPVVRMAARLADPRGIPLYRQILAPHVIGGTRLDASAAACLDALARLRAKEATIDFRLLLRSPVPAYRAGAARGLAALGDRESLPMLARLVDDPFPLDRDTPVERVWHAAMDALEKISGVKAEGASVADRRAFWRRWHADRK